MEILMKKKLNFQEINDITSCCNWKHKKITVDMVEDYFYEDTPRSGAKFTAKHKKTFEWLREHDIEIIVQDFAMSEHHLGGDDIVKITNDVLKAQQKGYTIYTWYGPETEVLIFGIKE